MTIVWGQTRERENAPFNVDIYPHTGMTHRLVSPHTQRLQDQGQLMVVVDCKAGSAGRPASQWAACALTEAYYDSTADPWNALHKAAQYANKALHQYLQDREQSGRFSMTAAVIHSNKLHIVHGGQFTYASLLSNGVVHQITQRLYRPIGIRPRLSSDMGFALYRDISLRNGDLVVLGNVELGEWARAAGDKAPRRFAQYLFNRALLQSVGVVVACVGRQKPRAIREMFHLGERVRRMSWKQRLITAGAGSLTLATLCATVSLITFAARGPVQDEDNVPTPTPRQPTLRISPPTLVWSTPEGEGTKETPAPTMTPEPRPTVTPIKGD
jgi:hypothetical protein